MADRRMQVRPSSRTGWAAVWLAVAFVAWSFVLVPLADAATEGPDRWSIGPLDVPGAVAFVLAVAAGALACVAMLRDRDRAVLVVLALVPALLAVTLELAEALG